MLDYFRILKGLQLDETVVIVTGTIDPSVIGYAAVKGSVFLQQSGTAWLKTGPADTNWTQVSFSSLQLYAENPVAPTLPSAIGTNSIALGDGATANALDSLAIGNQSLARTQGGVVQASGRFGISGDAQTGKYLLRNITANAAVTELFVDGTGASVHLVLPDDSTWTFRITITGHRTDASDGHAGYEVSGVIYRGAGAGTTTIQGAISKDVLAESNAPWDVNTIADTVNGSLKVTVKGQAGKTIRWLAMVETVEITN